MMKHIFARILGLLVLGAFAIVVPEGAQAVTSTGSYYAEPSWDQKLPASTRFVVLSDWNSEAVLDRNTGLVWEKAPSSAIEHWNAARITCINKNVGGQKGWRLPSIPELASLVDPSVAAPGPTLSPGHPFTNIQISGYWSATSSAEFPSDVWLVEFVHGEVLALTNGTSGNSWCVRGGGPLTVY